MKFLEEIVDAKITKIGKYRYREKGNIPISISGNREIGK